MPRMKPTIRSSEKHLLTKTNISVICLLFDRNLSSFNLGVEISPAIGDLKNLQTIDLKGNRLSGQIPDEIGNCLGLQYLDLSADALYGDIPYSISKLKQLELLSLKNNQLTGPIPSTLSQLPILKTLSLKINQLTGPIPSTLSQLPILKTLDLAQNQLTGDIPRLIYWNEVLQGLRGNSLTGTLSPDMCQLTGLWYFDVRGNNITGTIPENIGNCTSFEILSLQGNRLTGKKPEVLGLMQALAVLDLSENQLVGPIPPILGNLSYTGKLYLHGNKLTGPVHPELGNMSKLSYLQLNDNHLVGGIPAELGKLEEVFNNISGKIPKELGQLQNINSLILTNRFYGEIPSQLTNCFSLNNLDLSNSNLSGFVPPNKNFSRFPAERYAFLAIPCYVAIGRDHVLERLVSRAAVLLIVFGCISLLLMVIVAIYRSNQQSPPKMVILHMDMAIHSYEDILSMTENFSEKYIVGYGASSIVYKCVLKNSKPIAIKPLSTGILSAYMDIHSHPTETCSSMIACRMVPSGTFFMYARTSRLNEKSVVYSFGVVLLELLTGKKAVDNEFNLHQLILSKADDNTRDLAQNQLTGDIPRGLRGNSLTGTLSPDMCQLTGLWYFDVRCNNITGTIHENIGNCTRIFLQSNHWGNSLQYWLFTSGDPVLGLMQALAVLDLSENELVGPIPPILGNLSYTGKLYLHGNKHTGPIPPELGNMSKLSYLQLNDNHLVGGIPAELGKLEELFELNLGNNFLEGPIPENISSCTALNQLNVYGNKLNGSIPSGFKNLGSLTYLNLSTNHFKGQIPFELGRIINLDTLDLSSNNFAGRVPSSVGDLEHLLTLNLSKNHLNGPMPAEFGNLRSIQILDMSFNNLSGMIPEELGQLQNINSLILTNNSFYGEIPSQLTNCFSLDNLDLSNNNLSGLVPPNKNFSRFPAESFSGNPLLCGNWSRSCFGAYVEGSKGLVSRAAVLLIIFGCISLLLMVIVAIYRSNQQSPPKMVILHMDMAIHSYKDILSMTENFSEKYIVGYGASSTFYKCVLKNSKPIAIKHLYTQHPHNTREFETELETIGSIKHRNLVSLHGYSLSPNGNLLFYDYMQNGSLWDLLHGAGKKVKLDWDARLRIAVGAAQGLAYLHHDCNPRVIHRDIESSNILIDDNFEAHLSDFGIAR
ncbi:hypothetical protein C5167_004987 [Papaver somniferum]|uniref:non-specific serine/threonine protein kinase n=1 Tax=Papaver somniferum TaxID=3469 RepID=A0A4Y7JAY5_PAPSO|nr:hypothetical protein C5167_004987 [Papaver somniferum]